MSIEAERKAERIPPTAFAAARCSYSEILNPAYSVSVLVCREMIPALYEACGDDCVWGSRPINNSHFVWVSF